MARPLEARRGLSLSQTSSYIENMSHFTGDRRKCRRSGKITFSRFHIVHLYNEIPGSQINDLITAVTTFSLLEFLKLPFGITKAGRTFQRYVYMVSRGSCLTILHLNDILITNYDWTEQLNYLRTAFGRQNPGRDTVKAQMCVMGIDVSYAPELRVWPTGSHRLSKGACRITLPEARVFSIISSLLTS